MYMYKKQQRKNMKEDKEGEPITRNSAAVRFRLSF